MILEQKPEGWGVALTSSGSCTGAWEWEADAMRVGAAGWALPGGCWRVGAGGWWGLACISRSVWLRMKSELTGRALLMRLELPAGFWGPWG